MAVRLTPKEIAELQRKTMPQRSQYVDHMPRVQNDSASTRAMWGAPDPQPTPAPLTEYEQKAVDEFHRECQQTNALEALKQIDIVFAEWFAEHAELSDADHRVFANRMLSILRAALGQSCADDLFDADARNEAAK